MLTSRKLASSLALVALGSMFVVVAACTESPTTAGDAGAAEASTSDAAPPPDAQAPDADAGDSPTTKCERLFDAALGMAQRCGAAPGAELSAQAYHSSDRSNYVGSCVAQASAAGYDTSRLDSCLGEAETTTLCVDLMELSAPFNPSYFFGGPSTLASCLQGPGTLAAGEGCAYGSQCASARCDTGGAPPGTGPSYCGKCAPSGAPLPAPAPVGAACDTSRPCVSGATCNGTCQAPGGDGASCSAGPCASGLACVGSGGDPRVCRARQPLGASCAGGLYCQPRLSCIGDQCVSVPIGKAGDDCSYAPGTNVLCDADLTCAANLGTNTRTCISIQTTQGQVGEECDLPTSTKACARSLWCVDHKCEQRASNRCSGGIGDAGSTDAQPKDAALAD